MTDKQVEEMVEKLANLFGAFDGQGCPEGKHRSSCPTPISETKCCRCFAFSFFKDNPELKVEIACVRCRGAGGFISTSGSIGGTLPDVVNCETCKGTGKRIVSISSVLEKEK